jgi:hypothetical protein
MERYYQLVTEVREALRAHDGAETAGPREELAGVRAEGLL